MKRDERGGRRGEKRDRIKARKVVWKYSGCRDRRRERGKWEGGGEEGERGRDRSEVGGEQRG